MSDPSIELYNAAVDAIQAGKLPEALAAAEESLTENPRDTETWRLYIMVLNALGRQEDARRATEKLSKLGLSEADACLLAASEAGSRGDLEGALAQYEKALAADNGRSEIHAGYALCLMEAGRSDEALAAATKGALLDPRDGGANYALGRILRLRGDMNGAQDALERAVAADPDLLPAIYEHGMVLAENAKLEDALEMFRNYLRAKPEDKDAMRAVEIIRHRMHPGTR